MCGLDTASGRVCPEDACNNAELGGGFRIRMGLLGRHSRYVFAPSDSPANARHLDPLLCCSHCQRRQHGKQQGPDFVALAQDALQKVFGCLLRKPYVPLCPATPAMHTCSCTSFDKTTW